MEQVRAARQAIERETAADVETVRSRAAPRAAVRRRLLEVGCSRRFSVLTNEPTLSSRPTNKVLERLRAAEALKQSCLAQVRRFVSASPFDRPSARDGRSLRRPHRRGGAAPGR